MIIIDHAYGKFPEINHLNSNFRQDINKIKMTIEVISPQKIYRKIYPIVQQQFHTLFPNLRNHDCCVDKTIGFKKHTDSLHGATNYALHILHLLEHVLIDIQCSITKMKKCSGITCNYHKPRNRYDIFVECIDKTVGYAAASTASESVQQLLNYNRYYGVSQQLTDFERVITSKNALSKNSIFSHDYCSYVEKIMLNPQEFMKN
ncbi:hypothetical protein GF337_18475 [candidate division KSB1 bacterium]|nr:hypothetical protein [candidate division KSB1 bacterium]